MTHVAHSRISLHPGQVTGFTTKLLYAVAYASPFAPFGGFGGSAVVPGGIPLLLGSTAAVRD